MICSICDGRMEPRDYSIPAYECTKCPYVWYIHKEDREVMAPITNILDKYLVEEHRKQQWKDWWGIK